MQTLLIEMNKTCCFYRDECDANSSEMDSFIKEIEDFLFFSIAVLHFRLMHFEMKVRIEIVFISF